MSAPERIALGSWSLPSGNACDAFLDPSVEGVMLLALEWDAPPPFSPMDTVFYLGKVLPAIHRRIAEWREQPVGPAVVVLLDQLPVQDTTP